MTYLDLCRSTLVGAATLAMVWGTGSCGSADKASPNITPVPTQSSDAPDTASTREEVALGQCTAATAVAASQVSIKDYAFDPACIKVAVGSSLTFTNVDSTEHTATTGKGAANTFDSGKIKNQGTYSATFTKAGTTGIYCTVHPTMQMNVWVQ